MNHWAGKVVVSAQDNLMKARDELIALMNEILGAIRMLKVCLCANRSMMASSLQTCHAVYGLGAQLRSSRTQNS
jgi:hypothetical protein